MQDIILAAPRLFEAECDGAIAYDLYYGNISAEAGAAAYAILDDLPVAFPSKTGTRDCARKIAKEYHQERCYDATYAALAEMLGCEFWTADKAFYDAVHEGLPCVHFITEFTLDGEAGRSL